MVDCQVPEMQNDTAPVEDFHESTNAFETFFIKSLNFVRWYTIHALHIAAVCYRDPELFLQSCQNRFKVDSGRCTTFYSNMDGFLQMIA
jgi:hypothetical protein